MKTARKVVLTLSVMTMGLLAGCATTIGKDFNQSTVQGFIPHQTTMDQAIAALGQPQERETESDGSTRLHYQFVVSKTSVGDFVPFAPTSANVSGKDTFLYFDKSGRYLRSESNQSNQ